jgi:hypothetical protein
MVWGLVPWRPSLEIQLAVEILVKLGHQEPKPLIAEYLRFAPDPDLRAMSLGDGQLPWIQLLVKPVIAEYPSFAPDPELRSMSLGDGQLPWIQMAVLPLRVDWREAFQAPHSAKWQPPALLIRIHVPPNA